MKKLNILIAVLILIGAIGMGYASAYVIGQIITQSQLNNLNADNLNLDINVNSIYKKDNSVFVEFDYTTLKKYNNTEDQYEIVLKKGKVACPMRVYSDCRLKDGLIKTECVQVMRTCLRDKVIRKRESERNRISNWQTEVIKDELSGDDLDLGDLNE